MRLKLLKKTDSQFYTKMGEFFASKNVSNELCDKMYDNNYLWFTAFYQSENEILGFIAAENKKKFISIKHGYTINKYRNNGVYSFLIGKIIEYYKNKTPKIKGTASLKTINILKRHGFKEMGKRGQYTNMIYTF